MSSLNIRPAPVELETSDVVERAHEEDLFDSPSKPLQHSTSLPHVAISIPGPSSPEPPTLSSAVPPSTVPDVDPLSTVPHPLFFRPTHPLPVMDAVDEALPAPARILASAQPESTEVASQGPCPVEFHARPVERFSTPSRQEKTFAAGSSSASLRVSELVHAVDAKQADQRRWMQVTCIVLTMVAAFVLIAFIAGVYYMDRGIDPPLPTAAVQSAALADGAVTSTKIAPQAVTSAALNPALASCMANLNATYTQSLALLPTAGAGLTLSPGTRTFNINVDDNTLVLTNGALRIATGGIQTAQLATASITATQLTTGAVTTATIAAGAVGMTELSSAVLARLASINSTASAALAAAPTAGTAIAMQGTAINLVVDPTYFVITPTGQLTIGAGSLDSSLFLPASVSAESLAPSVLELVPLPGAGLASVYTPFNSTVFSVAVDNSSLVLSAGAVSLGLVSAQQLAAGAVTTAQLAVDVQDTLASINATANAALQTSLELELGQSFLQQQLLVALGLDQSGLLQLASLSSAQLLDAILHINATAFSQLTAVNYSTFQLTSVLSSDIAQVQQRIASTYANLTARLPQPGNGVGVVAGSPPQLSLEVDGRYFTFDANQSLTLLPGSIDSSTFGVESITSLQIAPAAVTTAALADGGVTITALASNVSSVLRLMSAPSNNTLMLGVQRQPMTVTRSAGGDLVLAAGDSVGAVQVQSSNGSNAIRVAGDGSVTVWSAALSANVSGPVQLSASTLSLSGANVSLSSAAGSIGVSGGNASITGTYAAISAQSLQLQSIATNITSPHVTISGSVLYVPTIVPLSSSTTQYNIDVSALTAPVIRLTGDATALTLTFSGCSDAYAGRAVSIYNQLDSSATVAIPAASCSRTTDLSLLAGARLTVTCSGVFQSAPQMDCEQGELAEGGLPQTSTTQTISNNVVNGVAATGSSVGVLQLSFTPVNNVNPIVSFVLSSPLYKQGASALQITAVNSGVTNPSYAGDKMTPVWVVGGQVVDSVGGSVTVTLVNVGDPLYAGQQQLMSFLYQIV